MDRLRILAEELDTVSLDSGSAALREGTDVRGLQEAVYAALCGRYGDLEVVPIGAAKYRKLRAQGMDAYNQDGRVVYPATEVVGAGRSRYDLTHEVAEALYRRAHGMAEALHENPEEHVAMDAAIVLPVLRAVDPVAYVAALQFYETEAPAAERALLRKALGTGLPGVVLGKVA